MGTFTSAAALLLAACGGDSAANARAEAVGPAPADAGPSPNWTRVNLIDPSRWTPLSADEDPFEDRPEDVHCPESALMTEPLGGELSYGIDTGMCNYVTAKQTSLVPVTAGETIQVRLWHFALSASEPAKAHVVLTVNGLGVLEKHVPIPSASGLITAEASVREFVPAGSPVLFHLHNHGENSWSLVEVSAGI